jgi:tyrosine-protein kinase Etk/Wzc
MEKLKPISGNNIIDAKDVKNIINTILKNWYWFVLFMGLTIGLSIFQLYKSTYYYGAEAKILLKPQKNAFKDALDNAIPTGPNDEEVANEILILRSKKLVSETIKKLNLDISYYVKGRLKTGEVFKGTPFSVEGKVLDDKFYGAECLLKILSKEKFLLDVQAPGFSYKKEHKFGDPIVTNKFSIVVTGNQTFIENNPRLSEIQYSFVINNHDYLVSKYQYNLGLEKDENASAINISLEDEVADKAVAFLDTLTNIYINYSISVSRTINDNSLKFINDELKTVEDQLNGVETNLLDYQQQSGAIDVANQQSAFISEKMNVQSEKAKLMVQLNSTDYIYQQLTNTNADVTTISPSILADQDNPALANAFSEFQALQQRKSTLSFSNTESSPVMVEITAQLARARENVVGIVQNVRKGIAMRINALSAQEGGFNYSLNRSASQLKGLTDITRKKEINEKMYLFLLETRSQTIIAKAAIVPDKFILETASHTGLIRPIKNKMLLMGAGIGLALAALTIFLKSIFLNYLFTKEELSDLTTLPIVGVVGKSPDAKKDYLVVHNQPQSLTAEAFRVIRTNLSYFSPKSSSKVFLFTSSISGEGKSFCSINTGTILARAKKKVVIVDLDLHKPKQATAFNLTNDIGVTSYMVGKASLKDIIKDTPVENMKLVLSGPKSPNASELILDPMMEQMINELKEQFDYVILDMPPVGLLSDALVLMKFSDLNLYVLKAGYSKKDFVEVAHNLVEKNNVKSLGFILNSVSPKNIPVGYGGAYYKQA